MAKKIKLSWATSAEGYSLLRDVYLAESETVVGEFLDYVVKNMEEFFHKDMKLSEIMMVIQAFREASSEDEISWFCLVEMVHDETLGMKVNDFQDYAYIDGSFVQEGTRIGIRRNGRTILDEGIDFADTYRYE